MRREKRTLMQILQVDVLRMPREERLQCVDEKVVAEEAPWLRVLGNADRTAIDFPTLARPPFQEPIKEVCEEMLTDVQRDERQKMDVDDYAASYERPSFDVVDTAAFVPIIDTSARDAQSEVEVKLEKMPVRLGYMRIKGIEFEKEGFSNGMIMDMLVYTNQPCTESLRVVFGYGKAMMYLRGNVLGDVVFVYRRVVRKARLVCVLYNVVNGILTPVAIGHELMAKSEMGGVIEPIWCKFSPKLALEEHFVDKSTMDGLTLKFSVETLKEFVPGKTVRMAAVDGAIPTPILTVSNVKINDKTSSGGTYFCKVEVKRRIEGDEMEALPVFVDPMQKEMDQEGQTSHVNAPDKVERVNIPDCMNFALTPKCVNEKQLVLVLHVVKTTAEKKKTSVSGYVDLCGSATNLEIELGSKKSHITVSVDVLYPALMAPPGDLREILLCEKPVRSHPMLKDVAVMLCLNAVENRRFSVLCDVLSLVDMRVWIEHEFTPPVGFTEDFLDTLIVTSFADKSPAQVLLMVFKSVCVEGSFHDHRVKLLLQKLAKLPETGVKDAVATFLILLRMTIDAHFVHKLTLAYLMELDTNDRLYVYKFLFYDIGFVQSLAFAPYERKKNEYPYIPVLSLFFSSITDAFSANNPIPAVLALSILATTIEQYSELESSKMCGINLFPILPLVFTYFDSLKDADTTQLIPLIFYLFRNCDMEMFGFYYSCLIEDTQIRFLDFMVTISDVERRDHSYEVIKRIVRFLQFFKSIDKPNERIATRILTLLLNMMKSTAIGEQSYILLFNCLAFFVNQMSQLIFVKQTNLISLLIYDISVLTQRKLQAARTMAAGFIKFLITSEMKVRKSPVRCEICLRTAICDLYSRTFIPFFLKMRHFPKSVLDLYKKLTKKQPTELIEEYSGSRALIASMYAKLAQKNKEESNIFSAFKAEWNLCSVVINRELPYAEKHQFNIDGLDPDCAYLANCGPWFNKRATQQCLEESINLAIQCNFYWILSNCVMYLTEILEESQSYTQLQELYRRVSDAYNNAHREIIFVREFVNGCEVVRTYKRGDISDADLSKDPNSKHKLKLESDKKELQELNAKNFFYDQFLKDSKGADWNDKVGARFIFTTTDPLPCLQAYSKVDKKRQVKYTKQAFFVMKLRAYIEELSDIADGLSVWLPHRKLRGHYAQSGVVLSAEPIISAAEKLKRQKKEYYKCVVSVLRKEQGAPNEIVTLAREILDVIVKGLNIAETILSIANVQKLDIRLAELRSFVGTLGNATVETVLIEY